MPSSIRPPRQGPSTTPPDVPGCSSTIYSGAEVTSAIWPPSSPASKMLPDVFSQLSTPSTITLERSLPGHHHLRHHPYARCEEGIQGGGTRGGERGDEGQAGVRNYEEFLVLMYSNRKLSTAPNQFLISCSHLSDLLYTLYEQ